MQTPRLPTVGILALLAICSIVIPQPAVAVPVADYFPLIMNASWLYQNIDPPFDFYGESVFDLTTHEGEPAVRIGEDWGDHTLAFNTGRTLYVHAEVDEGVLYDFAETVVLGTFSDGMTFDICPLECETLIIRDWDALDPTQRAIYAIDPAYDDLIVIASYDTDEADNFHNAILAWNLPDGIEPPPGGVTNIDWYQFDMGLVASREVEADTGDFGDRYDLVSYVVGVDDDLPAARPVLHQNFPNPFNPATNVRFTLPSTATVSLTIHDAAGRVVCHLDRGTHWDAGTHTVTWRGLDDRGRPLASGMYLCRLHADEVRQSVRMTLIR